MRWDGIQMYSRRIPLITYLVRRYLPFTTHLFIIPCVILARESLTVKSLLNISISVHHTVDIWTRCWETEYCCCGPSLRGWWVTQPVWSSQLLVIWCELSFEEVLQAADNPHTSCLSDACPVLHWTLHWTRASQSIICPPSCSETSPLWGTVTFLRLSQGSC